MPPSTSWNERVGDNEADEFAKYAASLVELQKAKSERAGVGRALHRKGHLGLRGRLVVRDGVPSYAKHGLFEAPASYEVRIRLSNGSSDHAPDRKPDVRGFAFSVAGVRGASVFGGPAASQDFALIPYSSLPFPTVDEFMGFALAGSRGPGALLAYLGRRYGAVGAIGVARRLVSSFAAPFPGFANATFFSAAPIACGPYAARVRLAPIDPGPPRGSRGIADDMIDRLRRGPVRYELALQFYVDESQTPIEDPSIDWAESVSPYVPVAELEVAQQDPTSAEGKALAESIERGTFDPWSALAAHRPLGATMRARKVAYFESQKARGAR